MINDQKPKKPQQTKKKKRPKIVNFSGTAASGQNCRIDKIDYIMILIRVINYSITNFDWKIDLL